MPDDATLPGRVIGSRNVISVIACRALPQLALGCSLRVGHAEKYVSPAAPPLRWRRRSPVLVTNSGRSTWFVGVLVLMVSLTFAMTCYLLPPVPNDPSA